MPAHAEGACSAQLGKLARHFPGCSLRICYEASYIGYSLQRDLRAQGLHCDVVAPTSIPTPCGNAIKTNRIDAGIPGAVLCQRLIDDCATAGCGAGTGSGFAAVAPESVTAPDGSASASASLVAAKRVALQSRDSEHRTHWTTHHDGWLERTINGLSGSLKINLDLLLRQLKGFTTILS